MLVELMEIRLQTVLDESEGMNRAKVISKEFPRVVNTDSIDDIRLFEKDRDGLLPDDVQESKMSVVVLRSSEKLFVRGTPSVVMEKLQGSKKTLLKG